MSANHISSLESTSAQGRKDAKNDETDGYMGRFPPGVIIAYIIVSQGRKEGTLRVHATSVGQRSPVSLLRLTLISPCVPITIVIVIITAIERDRFEAVGCLLLENTRSYCSLPCHLLPAC